MKIGRNLLIICIFLALAFSIPVGVGAEDLNLTPEQRSFYNQMVKSFIAPDFCGKSLEECPAKITVEMRDEILRQVKAGKTKEEIIDYWTGVYGTKILSAPPKSGFFLSAWVFPIIGLLAGVIIVGVAVKGRLRSSEETSKKLKDNKLAEEYPEELKEEILKHL